jgi:DUF917 family protein
MLTGSLHRIPQPGCAGFAVYSWRSADHDARCGGATTTGPAKTATYASHCLDRGGHSLAHLRTRLVALPRRGVESSNEAADHCGQSFGPGALMWEISEADLLPISVGAAVLGSGGGGNPYLGYMRMRRVIEAGARVRVIDPEEIADDDLLVSVGGMGSPMVSHEKLAGGNEETVAARALEKHLGRRFDAIAPFEMGGGNSMIPMLVAAAMDIPLVDGDGMGRAFPELQMITYLIYGGSPAPSAIADERGNEVIVSDVTSAKWLERIMRAATIEMGGHTGLATAVMDGAFCKRTIIPNTLLLARSIGGAVHDARATKSDPGEAIAAVAGGARYLRGKVIDVDRRTTSGFARGEMTLVGLGDDTGRTIRIDFQNENLAIWENGEPQVTVPDLITLVVTDTGEPITTEVLRFGVRADVLVLPSPALMATDVALDVVGPRAFGIDVDYRPFL